MVFEKGNSLRRCVNKALNRLWANGTIKADPEPHPADGRRRARPQVAAGRRPPLPDPDLSHPPPRPGAGGPHRGRQHDRLPRAPRAPRDSVARLGGVQGLLLRLAQVPRVVPGDRPGVPHQRQDLRDRRGDHPRHGARAGGAPEPARPRLLPDPRARDRLHGLLPRRADDPRDPHARNGDARARRRGRSRRRRSSGRSSRSSSSTRPTCPRSTGRGSSPCIRARTPPRARSG